MDLRNWDWKHALLGLAALLGIVGTVVGAIPQAAPAAPVILAIGEQVRNEASRFPDRCPPVVCACDAKGDCGVHGQVSFPDGGNPCLCP